MNFIALLLALVLEKIMSERLALREPGWLLSYARFGCELTQKSGDASPVVAVVVALLPAAAVGAIVIAFAHVLEGVFWVLGAAVVLFFSLGPRDLAEEVKEYCAASRSRGPEAEEEARDLAAEILGHDARQRRGPELECVADATLVQANNRLFGVLFWFVVLPPAGALLFRITDLLRREAILRAEALEHDAKAEHVAALMQQLHGVLAWLPARLLALTYGIAGSFDDAFAGWRSYLQAEKDSFFEANDRLLVHAGRGALGARFTTGGDEAEKAEHAMRLVHRSLFVWLTAIALLTLVARLP